MHRLLKGAFLTLALAGAVLSGCGGGSSSDETTGKGSPQEGKAGREAHGAVDGRRRQHRLRHQLLPDGLHGLLRDPAPAVLVEARRRRDPGARPRRVRSAGLRGRQDRHREDPHRREVQPAGQPRGDVQGRQVRDRARLLQHGPERLRGRLLRRPGRRQAGRQARARRSRASRRRTTRRSSSSSSAAPAACWPGRSRCRSARRCRRSTRRSSTPSSRRCTARTRSRPART